MWICSKLTIKTPKRRQVFSQCYESVLIQNSIIINAQKCWKSMTIFSILKTNKKFAAFSVHLWSRVSMLIIPKKTVGRVFCWWNLKDQLDIDVSQILNILKSINYFLIDSNIILLLNINFTTFSIKQNYRTSLNYVASRTLSSGKPFTVLRKNLTCSQMTF